jgi:RNA polymerase sigma-54 factor
MNEGAQGRLEPALQLRQTQQLALTPALQQSLHILALPALELSLYIRAQVEQNPLLELAEFSEEADSGEAEAPHFAGAEKLAYDEAAYEESWQRYVNAAQYEPHLYAASAREAAPPDLSAVLPAREEQGLATQLRLQLALKQAPTALKEAAELIIEYLDGDGYLSLPLSALEAESGCGAAVLEQALALVQSLEPPGVAARDLRECLRLQIGSHETERELLCTVIENHLPDVAAQRVREAARALKVSAARMERVFQRIRALAPRPAAHLSGGGGEAAYIAPDVIIRQEGAQYQVLLNDSLLPRVYISPVYRRAEPLLRQDKEAAAYVKRALGEAHSLLRNIEKRRQTVYRLALLTAERQHGFFEHGPACLAPWTMKEAAEQLELHESTISRAIAGKYVQTPRGVFLWKYFFPRAYGAGPGALTPAWAKEQLKELVAVEDKARPFSDRRLAEILGKRGLTLARRTVAKYREQLGIAARHLRRRG